MRVRYETMMIKAGSRRAMGYRCKEIGLNEYMTLPQLAKKCDRYRSSVAKSVEEGLPYYVPYGKTQVVDGTDKAPDHMRDQWVTKVAIIRVIFDLTEIKITERWIARRLDEGVFRWELPDPALRNRKPTKKRNIATGPARAFLLLPRCV